ncbi:hypothetical protein PC110_g15794 [Phytophthora cactorum]|uniref:Integrase catalytic domain-containing protein n=1 Tax=Phytophthora cactorum TaxID=29920 RepID=A0A329RT06_9STRA|nr:hypothetical protein PC110_g15794 [Phytophthora cactorum]
MDVDHERGVISTLQNTSTESSDVNLPRTSTEDLSVTVDSNQVYHNRRQEAECGRGFQKKFATAPLGHGTAKVVLRKSDVNVVLSLRNAYYVPDSKNLLLHSQLEDEGYDLEYHGRSGRNVYKLWKDDEKVLHVARNKCGLYTFSAYNDFLPETYPVVKSAEWLGHTIFPKANISAVDGIANLQRWHERQGYLCPQYVKIMADRDLVTGTMFQRRVFSDCEACHVRKDGANAEKAVLVIADDHTRHTTVYPLKSKTATKTNAGMKRYIAWAERQFSGYLVLKEITDNGGEVMNAEMQS